MRLKIKELTLLCLLAVGSVTPSQADKIWLKDGRELEGDILEQTSEYTTINVNGYEATYYADQLKGSKPPEPPKEIVVPQPKETGLCQAWFHEVQATEEAVNIYKKEMYVMADNLFLPLAKQGNLRAAIYLWDINKYGKGGVKNLPKADKWLKQAIDSDVYRAFFWLSEKDSQLDMNDPRIKEACDTQLKAEQGDAAAQHAIVELIGEYDRSCTKPSSQIIEWYKKAASHDDPLAEYKLGDYLATGPKRARNYSEGVSWLWKAYDHGEKEAINRLLKVYRDEVLSKAGVSEDPFFRGNQEFAQRILSSNIEQPVRDQFVIAALEGKDSEILRCFLDKGTDPNSKMKGSSTLLMTAVEQNDVESVRVLLEYKADPNVLDKHGDYPLLLVASSAKGDLEIARLLLDHGAKPDGVTPEGVTKTIKNPLGVAAGYRNLEMMALLVEKGADVNFQAGDGHTLLMWAAKAGVYEVVEFLMKHGADPTIKNAIGATAIYYADTSLTPDPRIKKLLHAGPPNK